MSKNGARGAGNISSITSAVTATLCRRRSKIIFGSLMICFLFMGVAYQKGYVNDLGLSSSASTEEKIQPRGNGDVVAWLTMGPAKRYPKLRDRFQSLERVDFFYHSFDEPCQGCIFQKGTTFAEGRNLLLRKALETNHMFKYFAFFDDDIELLCGETLLNKTFESARKAGRTLPTQFSNGTHLRCWESFTNMLLDQQTTFPFIKPLFVEFDRQDAFTIKYQSCADECFKAYHRDYLWFFFPSSSYLENLSWWFNGRSKMYLAQRCFHYAWRVDGNWGAHNSEHRRYPKNEKVDRVPDLLEHSYPELGPWNVSKLKSGHRCEISPTMPIVNSSMDPLCVETLKSRFDKWWKTGSYKMLT